MAEKKQNKQYGLDTITPVARLAVLEDIERCALVHLPLTMCEGGRVVIEGFICPHCDSTHPKSRCNAPYNRKSDPNPSRRT